MSSLSEKGRYQKEKNWSLFWSTFSGEITRDGRETLLFDISINKRVATSRPNGIVKNAWRARRLGEKGKRERDVLKEGTHMAVDVDDHGPVDDERPFSLVVVAQRIRQ